MVKADKTFAMIVPNDHRLKEHGFLKGKLILTYDQLTERVKFSSPNIDCVLRGMNQFRRRVEPWKGFSLPDILTFFAMQCESICDNEPTRIFVCIALEVPWDPGIDILSKPIFCAWNASEEIDRQYTPPKTPL